MNTFVKTPQLFRSQTFLSEVPEFNQLSAQAPNPDPRLVIHAALAGYLERDRAHCWPKGHLYTAGGRLWLSALTHCRGLPVDKRWTTSHSPCDHECQPA